MFLTNLTVQDVRGSNTGGRYAVLGQISAQKIVKNLRKTGGGQLTSLEEEVGANRDREGRGAHVDLGGEDLRKAMSPWQ